MQREIKVDYHDLDNTIRKMLSAGAEIKSVSQSADREYVIVCDINGEADQRMFVEKEYKRLRRMEKRIKTYPELRKAVQAAMEHEDSKVSLYLNRHEKSLK